MTTSNNNVSWNAVDAAISERHKYWKENVPYLYDMLITHSLDLPPLTVQWLPYVSNEDGEDRNVHRLILGTYQPNQPNQLLIASIQLPNEKTQFKNTLDEAEDGGLESIGKFEIDIRITHEGEVNRARYMPQNTRLIATQTNMGDVLIFNYTKQRSQRKLSDKCRPELRLKSHTEEGYGLSWNPNLSGQLLSCSDDCTVCLWDINAPTKKHRLIRATNTYTGHTGAVGDVAWNKKHESIFGSVGYDKKLMIWDTRSNDTTKPAHNVDAHNGSIVNSLSFNSFSEFLLATSAGDKSIAIWDMRNLKIKVHTLKLNGEEFYQLEWSPSTESVLASSDSNNIVNVWDLSMIGEMQTPEDADDGPPELLFKHGGHTAPISEFSWNQNEPWILCSADTDNVVQVWQMGQHVWNDDTTLANEMEKLTM